MSGPSQPKVIGEEWSDDRIAGFLSIEPRDQTDPDYHVLRKAYEHMTPELFERFLELFVKAGRSLDARGPDGQTLTDRIRSHGRSQGYVEALEAASDR